MISLRRSDILVQGVQCGGHLMFTLGSERCGVRITRGKLSRRGVYHTNWLDIFVLWRGRRRAR